MVTDGTQRFPFDVEFQKLLLQVLCVDQSFAHVVVPYLQPTYFDNEVLAWAFAYGKEHQKMYEAMPSIHILQQQVRLIDPRYQPVYAATLEQVRQMVPKDEEWMRNAVIDFVKRNIFVHAYHESRGLYNSGKVTEAYDIMMTRMDDLQKTSWEPLDESMFFEELPLRHFERMQGDSLTDNVSTGLPWLDNILEGGLSKTELGILIAYAKCGKTSTLTNFGVAATRYQLKNVVHFVFEGSRRLVENRYDASFMDELYSKVKTGSVSSEAYQRAHGEYQTLKGKLVIRGFVDSWDYTVMDMHEALKGLKRRRGFVPDLIIVDYGDLLTGRAKKYSSETEKQKAAFRDLKSLANRGYAVWTASQAQRPDKGAEDKAHYLYARQIADCYEKVRVADFLGSLNVTNAERKAKVMRMLAELYRDNEANDSLVLRCDFSKMILRQEAGLRSPSMPDAPVDSGLGWQQVAAQI